MNVNKTLTFMHSCATVSHDTFVNEQFTFMPGRAYNQLFEIASDTYGYVTQDQVAQVGVTRQAMHQMVRRGVADHVGWGLYRITAMPVTPLDQLMEATLWFRPAGAVISHDTALDLYDVCDISPAKVHVTVPMRFRSNREIPTLYIVHRGELEGPDVAMHEGIPVAVLRRAIEQCHATGVRRDLLRQAIVAGVGLGLLTPAEQVTLQTLVASSVA